MTVALEARHIRLVTERTVDHFLRRLFLRDVLIRNLCIVSPFISQVIQQEALTRLQLEKRIFTQKEFLETVKAVDWEMNRIRIF
jgi:hypothetical protein